jgi:MFS family permease
MSKVKIITRNVLVLSAVSLFTDVASEMLYPIVPIYLKTIGFSIVLIGILEGFAEAIAGLSKGYFGNLSDRTGTRLPFIQIGYLFSAISKPMMALFTYPIWVFFVRTIDRLGKGVRTGARDALLSDEATADTKGRVFGFHRSMDTFGAVLGPLLALMYIEN